MTPEDHLADSHGKLDKTISVRVDEKGYLRFSTLPLPQKRSFYQKVRDLLLALTKPDNNTNP